MDNAVSIFDHKLALSWWKAFFSGILCNFLVAGSVYISHTTRSSTAKFLLIGLVIMVFALSGFSHVGANAYVWGLGSLFNIYGIHRDFNVFLQFGYQIQLPTLIGNFIGGGVLLPGMYYLMFGKDLQKNRIINIIFNLIHYFKIKVMDFIIFSLVEVLKKYYYNWIFAENNSLI